MIQVRSTHIILYVKDQNLSRDFYEELLRLKPLIHVPGMTEFQLHSNVSLGLMPNTSIAKIITPAMLDPASGTGIPRCELYLYVSNVDELLENLCDVKVISPIENRSWGDRAFYIADPDGHVIAFAQKL